MQQKVTVVRRSQRPIALVELVGGRLESSLLVMDHTADALSVDDTLSLVELLFTLDLISPTSSSKLTLLLLRSLLWRTRSVGYSQKT